MCMRAGVGVGVGAIPVDGVGGVEYGREDFNAIVSQQDLVDSYLAPFQQCVEAGNAAGLMCSYNAVNGVPTCAWHWLLNETAREGWGFDGYITGDCGAARDVYSTHQYAASPEEDVRDVLTAGMDNDCVSWKVCNWVLQQAWTGMWMSH